VTNVPVGWWTGLEIEWKELDGDVCGVTGGLDLIPMARVGWKLVWGTDGPVVRWIGPKLNGGKLDGSLCGVADGPMIKAMSAPHP
jgi:hypothetical protein